MEFWRSEAYLAYFDHLDHHGGFYYEVRFKAVSLPLRPLISRRTIEPFRPGILGGKQ